MKTKLFAIYDEKGAIYAPPFIFHQDGQAKRVFSDMANDKENRIGAHPEDYKLYEIGTFDDASANVEALNQPNLLCSALELIVEKKD